MAGFYELEVSPALVVKANLRHDRSPHIICMWTRAKYNGTFGYPPDPKPRRPRLNRWLDGYGQIQVGVR